MYQNKQAFTLIELLVVVLIIGILAGVAVPQYKKTVTKTNLATLKLMVSSIDKAADLYYISNAIYPYHHVDELDISFPVGEMSSPEDKTITTVTFDWGLCWLDESVSRFAVSCKNDLNGIVWTKYSKFTAVERFRNKHVCCGYNEISKSVCQQEMNTNSSYWGDSKQSCYLEN